MSRKQCVTSVSESHNKEVTLPYFGAMRHYSTLIYTALNAFLRSMVRSVGARQHRAPPPCAPVATPQILGDWGRIGWGTGKIRVYVTH